MEDDLKILKLEYLSNHWLDIYWIGLDIYFIWHLEKNSIYNPSDPLKKIWI